LKRATGATKTKVTKVRAEPKIFGTADLKRIRYATTSVPFEWQTERFIWTAPREVVPQPLLLREQRYIF